MKPRWFAYAANLFERFSSGTWIVLMVAGISSASILMLGRPVRTSMPFWVFNEVHRNNYRPEIDRWNAVHPQSPINLFLIQIDAYERQLNSGFSAGASIGELLETERRLAAHTFLGPEDAIGFVDLTARLQAEVLLGEINAQTLAKIISWTVAPLRICTNLQDHVASGHQQWRDGPVLCQVMPDWMVGTR